MNVQQKIMRQIIIDSLGEENSLQEIIMDIPEDSEINKDWKITDIDETNIDILYEALEDGGYIYDAKNEFRGSGEETDIECDWSRHYESKSVARQLDDGTWVGWTYWHGGGKHGEPESIEWLSEAYELKVVKEEMVVKRIFEKIQE